MVKMIVDEMVLVYRNPTKKHCTTIAQKLVRSNMSSFADRDDTNNTVIGTGYDSWVCQLKSRVENLNRNSCHTPKYVRDAADTTSPKGVKRKIVDGYGCVNWQPERPADQTDEEVKKLEEELTELHKTGPERWDGGKVDVLMAATYYLQRKDINSGMAVADLQSKWPFLFQTRWMLKHFHQLVDIDLLEAVTTALALRGDRVVRYSEGQGQAGKKEVRAALGDLHSVVNAEANLQLSSVILLLMAHFDEKPSVLFQVADVS